MHRWGTVLWFAVAAGACGVTEPPEDHRPAHPESMRWAMLGRKCPPDAPADTLSLAARASVPPPWSEANEHWATVARRVPGGWGGWFLEEGIITMYLVDPTQKDAALAALRTEGIHLPSRIVVKQGRWSFAELYDWYRYVRWQLYVNSGLGVHMTDVQEARNRLEFAVTNRSERAVVEQMLADIGVPCFLVAIRIGPMAIAA